MTVLQTIGLVVASYLSGAIPFSFLVAKARGVDLRAVGSGNIGGANVWRSCGFGPFLVATALDILKGALAPLLGIFWLGLPPPAVVLVGLAAMLGHTYSVFMRFKGGKAVATGGGVLLALAPALVPLGMLVWALTFAVVRISSVASLVAVATIWVVAMLMLARGALPVSYAVFVTLGTLLVFVLHRANIRRLLQGQERRFSKLF
jgi:acyl phosphate:glycerol-3-phosphate acyltransferase